MKKTVSALLAAASIWIAGVAGSPAHAQSQPDGDEPGKGEILVKFKPGASANDEAEAHRRHGGKVKGEIAELGVRVVDVGKGKERDKKGEYAMDSSVLFVEENGAYSLLDAPNDPRLPLQWQYDNTGQTGGTADADIDALEAWQAAPAAGVVRIAVLDTGIDQSHEDVAAKIVANKNYTTSRTVDDRYGHGTDVAGSAAASTGNGIGVAGTCPNCTLMNVKVLGDNGSGSWSGIASGIVWAADNGAQVISMSLGGGSGSNTVKSAIDYAVNKGVVVVAAAGNSNTSAPSYPAYYANVIAVGATDNNDNKASFSNYGSWVDVAAPGVAILSTAPDHTNRIWGSGVKYGAISGTSMSTPHVAGVAGLVLATGRCALGDNICVRARIEGTTDTIPGIGAYWSHGRVNANNAIAP